MVDLQSLVDTLSGLDEESLVNVISSVLQARPEVAPPVVAFSIPDLTYPPSKALMERRPHGVVKSFNANSGFGFIDCPELHAVFGNDVFLHNKQLGGFGPGDAVSFAVCLSKDNKPQAYDLQPSHGGKGCGGGMIQPPSDFMQMKGKGMGWGYKGDYGGKGKMDEGKGKKGMFEKGSEKGMWAEKGGFEKGGFEKGGFEKGGKGKFGDFGDDFGAGMPAGAAPFQEVGSFTGTIKSFNPKSGYGFITCMDLQQMGFTNDVFLHHQQMGECVVGQGVSFTCYLNRKGQPQAKDVGPVDEEGRPMKRPRSG